MARLSTGPLVAGLSGGIGPVVFHQTKWGQVAQSKAKAKTWTTPAAMATKKAFRAGSTSYGQLGSYTMWNFLKAFDTIGKSSSGQWAAICSRAIREGSAPIAHNIGPLWSRQNIVLSPGGPTGWQAAFDFIPGIEFGTDNPRWVQLDADYKALWVAGSITSFGAPWTCRPPRAIQPPFLFVGLSVSQNNAGTYGQPFRAMLGPAVAQLV